MIQLSADHSLVAELVRSGQLAPAQARDHPDRHVITRALGIDSPLEVDCWQLVARDGDRYLLCSDGLTTELSEDAIGATLGSQEDPQIAADELVSLTLAVGARDNVSVVIIDVGQVESEPGDATNPRPDDNETQPRHPGAKGAALDGSAP
jgi:protein phosphatase